LLFVFCRGAAIGNPVFMAPLTLLTAVKFVTHSQNRTFDATECVAVV